MQTEVYKTHAMAPVAVVVGGTPVRIVCYDFPMARAARDLLTEALDLPVDERAKMAADLLDSLHDVEEDVQTAWAAEIQARVAAARAGELESTDWRTVLDRVEREVLGR